MRINVINPTAPATPIEAPKQAMSAARARAIAMVAAQGGQGQMAQQLPQQGISPEESVEMKTDEAPEHINTSETEVSGEDTSTPEQEVTKPTKEVPLSTQHALLAKKEKALRARIVAQEQSFKQKEADLQAREAAMTEKSTQDFTNYISKDKLIKNPLMVLESLGVTYEQLAEAAITQSSPEAKYMQSMRGELEEELRKVREEQANTKKSFEEQQANAYKQALNQIRNEVNQLVQSDPSFEMIKATGSVGDVVELIERTFKENGTLMTVDQAAQAIEDDLLEEAQKISQFKKVQDRLKSAVQSKAAAQPLAKSVPQQSSAQPMKTLTNAVSNTRPLSAKERALLAFRGELK